MFPSSTSTPKIKQISGISPANPPYNALENDCHVWICPLNASIGFYGDFLINRLSALGKGWNKDSKNCSESS